MEIKRVGSQPSAKGPAEWFSGTVRIDPLFQSPDPSRVSGASVTFEPGARTAWHTHPLGQTLIITAGWGWLQRAGGPVEEVRPGDIVWFEPGEKHWHGGTCTTGMTHIAIQERLNGTVGDWMEHVSDKQSRKDEARHSKPSASLIAACGKREFVNQSIITNALVDEWITTSPGSAVSCCKSCPSTLT